MAGALSLGGWALLVLLAIVAGVLSAVEAALVSASRARTEELLHEGRSGAKRLMQLLQTPERYLDTVVFVRTLAQVAAVVLLAIAVFDAWDHKTWVVVLVVLVGGSVSYVLVDAAPRALGRDHAEAVALFAAAPVQALTGVLGPVSQLLLWLGRALTFGRSAPGTFASEAELRELVDLAEQSNLIESDERAMIHSVFELGDTIVREVMVPRTDVVFIERHKTLRQAMSLFLRSGYSRVPVVGEDLDDIIGFAYLKDVSKRVFDRADAQSTEHVDSLMRPVLHVPDSKPVDDLLRDMQAVRRHIAVVVDEYGGTAGLVTIEDVLEEIVGEITDEFDGSEEAVEKLDDGSVRVPSRFPVDDLEQLIGGDLSEDDVEDVDSVGGLMAKHLGKVPIPGAEVAVGGLRFVAEGLAGRRKQIATVHVSTLR
ncbi:MAG TPA: hemolysin family protein, partial [Marmoricola sp.]|nr:hemolysin family protein [Marmoricola sp.]